MTIGKDKVYLTKDGIVEILVVGDQSVSSVQAMSDEAAELAKSQRLRGRRALILDNVQQIGNVPPEARQLVMELIRSSEYDKLAVVGSGPLMKLGANLILHATGRGKHVQYFDDRAAAAAWLKK